MYVQKISEKSHLKALEQKLLFYYWSYGGNKGKKKVFSQSDLYLCDDFSTISLYGLSLIIDKLNQVKAKSTKEEKQNDDDNNNKKIFVVDSTKNWKRIVEYISNHSDLNEIKFDNFEDKIFSSKIPSRIVLPSSNIDRMQYNEKINSFYIDGIMYNNIYQYKNCNVYDIFCSSYHSNRKRYKKELKFQSVFLLRIGVDCKSAQIIEYIFDLINTIWSKYKYKYQFSYNRKSINDIQDDDNKNNDDAQSDDEELTVNKEEMEMAKRNSMEVTLNNSILYLGCESITKYIGIWKIKGNLVHCASTSSLYEVLQQRMKYFHDIRSFTQHFIVSSASVFVSSYIIGLDWNEVLETCFIHDQYGDVYQLSPLSILFNAKNYKKSIIKIIDGIDKEEMNEKLNKNKNKNNNNNKNVFLLHIHKLLISLQDLYQKCQDDKQYENLWNIWCKQVKRILNIIIFNIDKSKIDKWDKDRFDYSNLYQILYLSKLLYCNNNYNNNDQVVINSNAMTQHFSNIIRIETKHCNRNMQ